MKVILCEHVANLGDMGQTVKVADGYARNFLIPRRLAVSLDSASAKQVEHEVRQIKRREEKVRAKLQEVAKTMEELTLEFKARAGEDEKLFGSVTTAMIAEQLKAKGHEVDRKSVKLEEPIKTLGIFTVGVKLGSGVEAHIKVWVAPEQPVEIPAEEDEEPVNAVYEDEDEDSE